MSRPYSVTISIFRSSCSFVRLKSPAEISRREEMSCIYIRASVYGCVYVHIYTHAHAARAMHNILRPQSSFTRYLAFPFLPFPLPALRPAFLRTLQQRCTVPMHVCVTHAHMFVFERALCSTCRGSLPMHANPVFELSKCTRKCITRTWERRRVEGGGRGEARGRAGKPRKAINCGSSGGTVTRPRRRLRNCGCHDIDTSAPTT